MRRLLALAAVGIALGAAGAAAEPAATVRLLGCHRAGGVASVPAGVPIELHIGWAVKTRGLAEAFLHAQETSLVIEGVPVPDAGSFWSQPIPTTFGGSDAWVSRWIYPTGTALAPGETLEVEFELALDHPTVDLLLFDGRRPLRFGPGPVFGTFCAIVGV